MIPAHKIYITKVQQGVSDFSLELVFRTDVLLPLSRNGNHFLILKVKLHAILSLGATEQSVFRIIYCRITSHESSQFHSDHLSTGKNGSHMHRYDFAAINKRLGLCVRTFI